MKKALISSAVLATMLSTSAFAGDVRIMWYSDGNEGQVMQDLVDRFTAENPEINIILDNVSYSAVREQLPIQLQSGQGPDIVRVTNLKEQAKHWLDMTPYMEDPQAWKDNYGSFLNWMRADGSEALPGFMTQVTLTGGFVNKTLFEQAGVAVPGPDATWDEWMKAAAAVAENQELPYAAALDRSGHRITGPNISYGAKYIGEDGMPAGVDEGMKAMLSRFVDWNNSGLMNPEVWVSAAGSTYRSGAGDFINGQIAYLYSGSWQISNFDTKIGDFFDWEAVGSPCGTEACSGVPGGAGLVAVKYTKNPEEVTKVMEWLGSPEVTKEYAERTLSIPANSAAIALGLEFKTENPLVNNALNGFVASMENLAPVAKALPAWKWANAYYGALAARVSQAIAGELTLDEAYTRMESDIEKVVNEASR